MSAVFFTGFSTIYRILVCNFIERHASDVRVLLPVASDSPNPSGKMVPFVPYKESPSGLRGTHASSCTFMQCRPAERCTKQLCCILGSAYGLTKGIHGLEQLGSRKGNL